MTLPPFFTAHAAALRLAVAAALLAGVGVQTLRLAHAENRLAVQQRAHAEQLLGMQRLATKTEAEYRTREATLQHRVDEVSHELQDLQAASTRTISGIRADAGRLREQLAAYATGGGAPTADTVAACRTRADRLSQGLGEVLRDYADTTADAAAAADYARALHAAWPRD